MGTKELAIFLLCSFEIPTPMSSLEDSTVETEAEKSSKDAKIALTYYHVIHHASLPIEVEQLSRSINPQQNDLYHPQFPPNDRIDTLELTSTDLQSTKNPTIAHAAHNPTQTTSQCLKTCPQ